LNDFKKILRIDLLELALRIWTAFFIFIYGVSKWQQFNGAKLIDISIKEATEFQIMWAFFGTTKIYPLIIGSIQITGAILLLFRKTKLFGATLLTPIFINIIILDILYKINQGALLNAIIFQSVLVFIFIQQRHKIVHVFNTLVLEENKSFTQNLKTTQFIVATMIAILMFFGYQLIT
jgi:hypothetical protein